MNAKPEKSWQGWVDENIQRGCSTREIRDILLANRFSVADVRRMMGDHYPAELITTGARGQLPGIDYKALSEIRLTRPDAGPGVERIDTPKLQLYLLRHFMTHEECDRLVEIIESALRPSTLTTPNPDKYFRTSRTSDLALLNNPFVRTIDEKIARALGIRLEYSEGIQAQKYGVGEEFKSHTDYFEPGTEEYAGFAAQMGNRTWTLMVYLDETKKGGGTQFVNIGRTFYPEKGMALAWNNLYADGSPNPDTIHWGMQIEEGQKTIITKWFREKCVVPMFY